MSFCHKLCLANTDIFATRCCRPLIFQTMFFVRSNNLSLKYQRFTPLGYKDIGLRTFKFVAKTQFLWGLILDLSIKSNPVVYIQILLCSSTLYSVFIKSSITDSRYVVEPSLDLAQIHKIRSSWTLRNHEYSFNVLIVKIYKGNAWWRWCRYLGYRSSYTSPSFYTWTNIHRSVVAIWWTIFIQW